MNPNDMGVVLDEIKNHGDSRKFTADMADTWAKTVYANVDEALEAVKVHYAESSERIMPAHINKIVARLRRARGSSADHIPTPDPPVMLADYPQDEARWIQRHKQLQAGGATMAQARAQTHYEFKTNDDDHESRPDMEKMAAEWAQVGVVMPDALLDPDASVEAKGAAATKWARDVSEWYAANKPNSLAAQISKQKDKSR